MGKCPVSYPPKLKNASQIKDLQGVYSFISDRGRIRTPNPQSRNLIFYPVELRGHFRRKTNHSYSLNQKLKLKVPFLFRN